jgi:hypothetical protein
MRKNFFIIAAALALVISTGPSLYPKTGERILVLGFNSRELNDVQEMLLRETIMRHLQAEGFVIVPVMEIESLYKDEQKRLIRKVKRSEVRTLCDETGAGFAFFGTIEPEDGKRYTEIKTGRKYLCTLTLYRKDKNRFQTLKLKVVGEDSLYKFYESLSRTIVSKINAAL